MVSAHQKFDTTEEINALMSKYLSNDFFACKNHNQIKYLFIKS